MDIEKTLRSKVDWYKAEIKKMDEHLLLKQKRIKELEGVLRKSGEHHQGGHSEIGMLIRKTLKP